MRSLKNKQTKKMVAVVIPLSNRAELTEEERLSLRHLEHYLHKYDKFMVAPQSLEFQYPGITVKRFKDRFFGSVKAHMNLVMSADFYRAFHEYEYMLIYHLDAIVFSDQLEYWCHQDYDFIGAPWIKHKDAPYSGMPEYEGRVGNGGFAIKKISSFIKLYSSNRLAVDPDQYWKQTYGSRSRPLQLLNYPKKMLKHFPMFNAIKHEISGLRHNSEELFLAKRATHYLPDFKIAPVDKALQFAFECVPRYCYEANNNQLPFGCHAWQRYDADFWKPFLLNNVD
ncbi:hypothetical protein DSCO28_33370 [Desulfosarcina ovata subsp. sediminis]|uniref:DUF5672 domain-containing protein n=1 Tax=Desulfosarcina ovata subsp. sediminis TaxID=885957 RepID=A0A5K7ZNI7_9BACT|nr:DUF5672 family protein [Desulfosarcina ovata]BBO82771.1 hypothetical protein DSCO28_33370 [Desulfosarcina ovata subsp. sediminis]